MRFIEKNPLCAHCLRETPPRSTPASHVDHIKPWQSGASAEERKQLFDDDNNLQSLCASHHSKKTATEDGGFGNRGLG